MISSIQLLNLKLLFPDQRIYGHDPTWGGGGGDAVQPDRRLVKGGSGSHLLTTHV